MIRDYANHAANERTFLAWVRTGIAIIALGFVIEKFNLFLLTVARTLAAEAPYPIQMQKLSDGRALWRSRADPGGVALILLSASRFIRTRRLLAAEETHPASSLRVEFALLMATLLFVAAFSVYAAIG